GSAACRRWSASPSALPWWQAGRECRGRRPEIQLCGFSLDVLGRNRSGANAVADFDVSAKSPSVSHFSVVPWAGTEKSRFVKLIEIRSSLPDLEVDWSGRYDDGIARPCAAV